MQKKNEREREQESTFCAFGSFVRIRRLLLRHGPSSVIFGGKELPLHDHEWNVGIVAHCGRGGYVINTAVLALGR